KYKRVGTSAVFRTNPPPKTGFAKIKNRYKNKEVQTVITDVCTSSFLGIYLLKVLLQPFKHIKE
ncbi:hypothetical protein, partial [Phocaeicola faecalis]